MSGYYCHQCKEMNPLFDSSGPSDLEIPCHGTVPFDPELARRCDLGIPFAELPSTPVGQEFEHVAQQLLERLESTDDSGSASRAGQERLR
jgi:hypothetical protein